MADQNTESAERVSALVDGQLEGDEFLQALAELESSAEARSNWDAFHMLGDVMRSGAVGVRAHDAEFVARFRKRLIQTTAELSPVPGDTTEAKSPSDQWHARSANDGSWWRFGALASVVLAGALGWQGWQWTDSASSVESSALPGTSAAVTTAGKTNERQMLLRPDGTSALAVAPESQVMIRNPQLDALLAAHRQLGGASGLQAPGGFLRSTTFDEGPR